MGQNQILSPAGYNAGAFAFAQGRLLPLGRRRRSYDGV
jgi:hypothetical protein